MHYLTDGMRSLAFYDGRSAAGLGTAIRVLALWWVIAAVVGFLTAWAIGRRGAPIGGHVRDHRWYTVVFGRPGIRAHLPSLHHHGAATPAPVDPHPSPADGDGGPIR